MFGDGKYLEAARHCAEVVWQRGLLRKGYGVCHGVAGNGYAFLAMYQLTKEEKYVYRAFKVKYCCCALLLRTAKTNQSKNQCSQFNLSVPL